MNLLKYLNFAILLLGWGCATTDNATYEYDPSGPPPGHSNHGEAFNEGPRQAAYLMGTTSNVSFPITTDSAEAQAFFDQGVGQLHGFWYLEAERSFRQVLKQHPEHPMAYWGMAMANANNRTRAQSLIKKAMEGRDQVSERERLWIDAMAAYQKESDSKKRKAARIKAYQALAEKLPNDLEAQAFYVLALYGDVRARKNYDDIEKRIAAILSKNPNHPCHHYRIHLWDYKDAKRALPSVGLCGQAAPGIAHMWHMPSHILSRLKRYHDASWQQEASARVDHAHMMRDRVMPDRIHNFAHNNEWLTRNLSHAGRVNRALAMAKNMIELPRLPNVKDDGTWSFSSRSSHTYGRRHLYGLLTNYELWDTVLALKDTQYLRPSSSAADRAKYLRLVAVAQINNGQAAQAQPLLAEMESLLTSQREGKIKAGREAETKAKNEKKKPADIKKAKTNAERPFSTAISTLERGLAEARMYLALQADDLEKARTEFAKVRDLRSERKALLQLRMGNSEEAIKLVASAVKSAPEQARPLAAQAYILHEAKKPAEAKTAFNHLRRIAPGLDLSVTWFARLAPLAESLKLPADWRQAQVEVQDMGQRPKLDDLGPFRWEPSAAPAFSLTDRNGTPFALDQYRDRSVVLIFYLGKGCPHCMEQLNAFDPLAAEFEKKGITLLAVSTDTAQGLRDTFIGYDAKDRHFNFPLLSDPSLETFRKYRAYDDFEQTPLHGTFLIDPAGRVRWQEISYEPFMAPKFLLEESTRLLAQEQAP